jgi:hypothetical protein
MTSIVDHWWAPRSNPSRNRNGLYVREIDVGATPGASAGWVHGNSVLESAARAESKDLLREAADLLADLGYVSANDPYREKSLRLKRIKIRKDWDDMLGWQTIVTVYSHDPIADNSRDE